VPEHLRALVVILAISTVAWAIVKVPFTTYVCAEEDFKRRRNLWFVITLAAFLSHNFWLFVLIAGFAVTLSARSEHNRLAMFLGLALALPWMGRSIQGLGIVNELFTLTPTRLLALILLLPSWLSLRRQPGVEPFGSLLCDKLLVAAILLEVALTLPERTLTSVMRDSVLYKFTDVFLVYYVASRSLRTVQSFRDVFGAFVAGAMAFCLVLVFEAGRNWLLYRSVDDALGAALHSGGIYLRRAGLLRAEGTAGQSIIAGLTCAVAIGMYLYVGGLIRSVAWKGVCAGILVLGLIAALARAPWLGSGLMLVVFLLLGPSPLANLGKLAAATVVVVLALVFAGAADEVIDFLPWVGTVDASTVAGREQLLTVALQVIQQNLLFGRYDFGTLPALEVLRDGSGIIDIVNTYLLIALRGGITSLGLFVGLAVAAMGATAVALAKVRDRSDERHAIGRSLMATLVGVMFIIFTVSPIFNVYLFFYALVGLAVGHARLVARGEPAQGMQARGAARPGRQGPAPGWQTAGRRRGV